jgi:hypothetical protein
LIPTAHDRGKWRDEDSSVYWFMQRGFRKVNRSIKHTSTDEGKIEAEQKNNQA